MQVSVPLSESHAAKAVNILRQELASSLPRELGEFQPDWLFLLGGNLLVPAFGEAVKVIVPHRHAPELSESVKKLAVVRGLTRQPAPQVRAPAIRVTLDGLGLPPQLETQVASQYGPSTQSYMIPEGVCLVLRIERRHRGTWYALEKKALGGGWRSLSTTVSYRQGVLRIEWSGQAGGDSMEMRI